ncbi:MAG: phosphatase PAP2 family protein [Propionivibrio sp.]
MNQLEALNRSFFLIVNGAPDTPPWLINTAIAVGEYWIYLIPVLLLALWIGGDTASRNRAVKAGFIAMFGVGLNQLIPLFWQHPRPFVLGLGHTWIPHAVDSSFPSDHLTVLASVGLTLLLDGAFRTGLITLFVGLCVGWARVFLGVHFPLDMLGAVGVAGFSYLFVSQIWRRAGVAITGLAERLYRTLLARPIAAGWIKR